jgi:hypothetical protein
MFHYQDNLYFGLMPGGDVRILKFKEPPVDYPREADGTYPEAILDVKIDRNSWISIRDIMEGLY